MKILLAAFCLSQAPVAAPAPSPPPSPTFTLADNHLVLPQPIAFETASDKLKPDDATRAGLDHVAAYLAAKTYISTLRVEGHVGVAGKDALALSDARALAVAKALVARGVDCKRLLAVGFGADKPVADASTPEGKAQNTRIDVVNAALRGHAIGGLPADGGGHVAGDVCASAAPKP